MMKQRKLMIFILVIGMIFSGCGSNSGDKNNLTNPNPTQNTTLQGTAQKGPFVAGSVVKIFKLDEEYARTSTYLETTTDGEGNYTFSDISWSGISEIEVSGQFLNENTGSTGERATVTSIVEVQNGQINRQNINVLTHMASGQVKHLLKNGKTLEEANGQVVGDLFGILGRTGLSVHDFGDLDIMDLVGSNATANRELLLISSALLYSTNYSADLELLLNAYKNGGIEGMQNSVVYFRLMANRQNIIPLSITRNLNLGDAVAREIAIPEMVKISKGFEANSLKVKLFGTEFTTHTPTISVFTTNGNITLGQKHFSDDNRSVDIEMSGAIGTCLDNKIYIKIAYSDLKEIESLEDLQSNTISTQPTMVVCNDNSQNGSEIDSQPVIPSNNLPPVAIIGMMDDAVDGQQAPQAISTHVGVVVNGLDTYYSHDQEYYPIGQITHCEWKDENSNVIKSSNSEECSIYDKIFNRAGTYEYRLTVTDNNNSTNSNTVTITVGENTLPSLTLSPSTEQEVVVNSLVEIDATAVDEGDTLTYDWIYSKLGVNAYHPSGHSSRFSHTFTESGTYNVAVTVTDSFGAKVSKSVTIVVTNSSDALPVAFIDDSNITVNQEIYVGQRPYVMIGGSDDKGVVACKWQDATGRILFEQTLSAPVTRLDYNECNYEFPTATASGTYLYSFMVKDTANQWDSVDLNLTVLANHVPTATIGENRIIEVGTTLNITAVVTHNDVDNDMTYQWMYGVKDSGTMLGGGDTLTFSHTFDTIGLYEVTFRVGDTHNTTSLVTIHVNVRKTATPTLPATIVTIGNLMWEDTQHSRTIQMSSWSDAQNYCSTLNLGTFNNWRLSTRDEIITIMAGEYNDNTKPAIVDGFVVFYPNDRVSTWLNNESGTTDHMVAWFDGGDLNIDGLTSTNDEQGVRCVRTK